MHKQLLAAVTAAGLFMMPVHAADMGGNCCSDLEERVAELEATAARKGNRKVSLTITGSVNQNILWADIDGDDDSLVDARVGNNSTESSRLIVKGSAKISKTTSVGFRLRWDVINNEGLNITSGLGNDDGIRLRESNIHIKMQGHKLTLGQLYSASHNVGNISLANNRVAARTLSLDPLAGNILGGVLSPNDLPFNGANGQGIRYNSPTFAGFSLSASWLDGDDLLTTTDANQWDVALRYAGEFGQIRVAAGVGYTDSEATVFGTGVSSTSYSGSVSVMHTPSGLFINGAMGHFDGDLVISALGFPIAAPNVDLQAWHIMGGIEQKFFTAGTTTIFAEFGELDFGVDGIDNANLYGLGLVQNVNGYFDVYATYRNHELNNGLPDIDTYQVGARIRF